MPLMAMAGRRGSELTSIDAWSNRCATADRSSRSTPSSNASQVMARYIAPVSRKASPSLLATPRAVVDLPEPLGPSMAMTSGRSEPESKLGSLEVSDWSVIAASDTRLSVPAASHETVQPRDSMVSINASACSGATDNAR
jgi:hypothetical protein